MLCHSQQLLRPWKPFNTQQLFFYICCNLKLIAIVFGYFYFVLSLTALQFSCNIAVDELAVLDLSPSYTRACGWPAPSGWSITIFHPQQQNSSCTQILCKMQQAETTLGIKLRPVSFFLISVDLLLPKGPLNDHRGWAQGLRTEWAATSGWGFHSPGVGTVMARRSFARFTTPGI